MKDSWRRILSLAMSMGSTLYFIAFCFAFSSAYVKGGIKLDAIIALILYTLEVIVIRMIIEKLKLKKNRYDINLS